METDCSTRRGVLTSSSYPSSLAERTLRRQIPKVGARCEMWSSHLCGLWRSEERRVGKGVDLGVTGVQTCALPISSSSYPSSLAERTLRRQIPKVGARCEMWSSHLCGLW